MIRVIKLALRRDSSGLVTLRCPCGERLAVIRGAVMTCPCGAQYSEDGRRLPREKGGANVKISDLVAKLEAIKAEHGDLETRWESLHRLWSPDPEVRIRPNKDGADTKTVILNS